MHPGTRRKCNMFSREEVGPVLYFSGEEVVNQC